MGRGGVAGERGDWGVGVGGSGRGWGWVGSRLSGLSGWWCLVGGG